MKLSYIVFFSIVLLFTLAFFDKPIEIIKELTIVTTNLISGYLGYLIRQLED